MNTEGKNLRPRWRISEEVASELARVRQQSAYPSWDDFYRALLRKWQETPLVSSIPGSPTSDAVAVKLDRLEAGMAALLTLVETRTQLDDVQLTAQERTVQVICRIHDLLSLALQVSATGTVADSASDEAFFKGVRLLREKMRRNSAGPH